MRGTFGTIARSLALLAASMSGGAAAATEALARIPTDVLEDFAGDDELEAWAPPDRRALIGLCAADSRPGVRRALARHVARCPLPLAADDEAWIATLAGDPEPAVREVVVASLGARLGDAAPLEAAGLLATLAVSGSPALRLALVRALPAAPGVLGARTALAHLHDDPAAEVAAAAREVARALPSVD